MDNNDKYESGKIYLLNLLHSEHPLYIEVFLINKLDL